VNARAAALALRRQRLVEDARTQRLRLAGDVDAVAAALRPRALAARLLGPLQAQPALGLLGLIGAAGLHRAGAARLVPQLLIAWRAWRALRGWLRR
jgi:hypothetical protein